MTEEELIQKIKNTPGGFGELFRLYYKPIFGYVFRRTGNFDETADITSETFLKAFKNIKKYTYYGVAIKVWLYRIATNEVNLYYRNKKRNESLFEQMDPENKAAFNAYIADDRKELELELAKSEQFVFVLKQLKTLPVKYQEVISLRYFEGKNNKEIAEILNTNEGTLKSLLSRGLEKLREKCNQL